MALSNSVECPKCGRKSLIERRDDLYQCIACDFKRDLSQRGTVQAQSGSDVSWAMLLALLITLAVTAQRSFTVYQPAPQQRAVPTSTQNSGVG